MCARACTRASGASNEHDVSITSRFQFTGIGHLTTTRHDGNYNDASRFSKILIKDPVRSDLLAVKKQIETKRKCKTTSSFISY